LIKKNHSENFQNLPSVDVFHHLKSVECIPPQRPWAQEVVALLYVFHSAYIIMYLQQLREMILPPFQNTLQVCNQISLLILYYI